MSDLDSKADYTTAQVGYSMTYEQRIDELKRELRAWRWLAESIVSPKGYLRKSRVRLFLDEVQHRRELGR